MTVRSVPEAPCPACGGARKAQPQKEEKGEPTEQKKPKATPKRKNKK